MKIGKILTPPRIHDPRTIKKGSSSNRSRKSPVPFSILALLLALSPWTGQTSQLHGDQDLEKNARSIVDTWPVRSVTLFGDRAQVTRRGKFNIKPGTNEIFLKDLAPGLSEDSLKLAWSSKQIRLISLFTYKRPVRKKTGANIEKLEAEIREKEYDISGLNMDLEAAGKILEQLRRYRSYAKTAIQNLSAGRNSSTGDWSSALRLFHQKEAEALEKRREINRSLRREREELDQLKKKLDKLQSPGRREIRYLKISIQSDAGQTIAPDLSLSYQVKDCGWQPRYSLRYRGNQKAELEYYALIRQKTGELWNKIDLTLSTARPSRGLARPKLFARGVYTSKIDGQAYRVGAVQGEKLKKEAEKIAPSPAPSPVGATKDLGSAVVFRLPGKQTLVSRRVEHRVKISEFQGKAREKIIAIPSLRRFAYLQVRSRNESSFPLLAGQTDIYRNSGFVGYGSLEYVAPGTPFDFSVGIEKDIKLEHRKVPQKSEESLLGGRKIFYKYFKTIVYNFKDEPATVTIIDRIPVSLVEDFEVELDKDKTTGGYELDKKTGRLEWKIKLKSGGEKTIRLRYSVKAPADFKGGF